MEAVSAADGTLALRYVAEGAMGAVRLPAPEPARRADELWRHTCMEAFVRMRGPAYCELNFSPSTRWAAYGFGAYRQDVRPIEPLEAPRITVHRDAQRLELESVVRLAELAACRGRARLALAAVIEDSSGRLYYWALRHSRPQPDFHDADAFCLVLEAAVPAAGGQSTP